jgi:prepilin-type N-terminal cleavage/methylation domain-containing protein
MQTGARRGFSLIELLVVIAIIALLAALLFPVFARVKEKGREATCLSNMHALMVAAGLYKDDNNDYPPMLLGYAERPDGLPWQPGDPGPVPADKLQHSPLLSYLKQGGIETFHCPDNPDENMTKVVTAVYPANTPFTGDVVFGTGGFVYRNLPAAYQGRPIYFYAFDSYDISSLLAADGSRVNGGFQLVYTRDWTGGSGTQDAPNQMKYRNAPGDKTILTWCDYHVTTAGADKCPVILLSGAYRTLDYRQLVANTWRTVDMP